MEEKKTNLANIGAEIQSIAETCLMYSWMICSDGIPERISSTQLEQALFSMALHLKRISAELDQ